MKHWVTEIKAIDPRTGELKTWIGPHVSAPTFDLAKQWCDANCGYLKIIGELVAEVPCKEGTDEPDWGNMVNYEKQSLN